MRKRDEVQEGPVRMQRALIDSFSPCPWIPRYNERGWLAGVSPLQNTKVSSESHSSKPTPNNNLAASQLTAFDSQPATHVDHPGLVLPYELLPVARVLTVAVRRQYEA